MKLEKFNNTKILVIGDLMLDKYIFGDVKRISPEAPVQVVNTNKEFCLLGGSGNVIRNLSTLGASIFVASVVDCGMTGKQILSKLNDLNVNTFIEKEHQKTSSKKTRIFSSTGQQLLRIDKETTDPIKTSSEKNILFNVNTIIEKNNIDAIIISDYNKGVLTDMLTRWIISLANQKNIPTIVDPKSDDFYKYRGASIITPNEKEAITASKHIKGINQCGKFIQMHDIKNVLITRGKNGMTLFEKQKEPITIPTKARSVYDVSGAGDTVVATLAVCIASGFSLVEAAKLANTAAGIVVGKTGVSTVTKKELIDFNISHKLKTNIAKISENERKNGRTIIFTNGCFDLIHAGHTSYLEAAKKLGGILIVGINSDKSVKKIKGNDRPILKEDHRIKVLSALQSVDYICVFDEETPLNIIKEIKPDILVKASDYTKDQIVGKDFVESYGGTVKIIDIIEKTSTTDIIKKVRKWKKS